MHPQTFLIQLHLMPKAAGHARMQLHYIFVSNSSKFIQRILCTSFISRFFSYLLQNVKLPCEPLAKGSVTSFPLYLSVNLKVMLYLVLYAIRTWQLGTLFLLPDKEEMKCFLFTWNFSVFFNTAKPLFPFTELRIIQDV